MQSTIEVNPEKHFEPKNFEGELGSVDYSRAKKKEIYNFLKKLEGQKHSRHRKLQLITKEQLDRQKAQQQRAESLLRAKIETEKLQKRERISIKLKQINQEKQKRKLEHHQFLKKLRKLKVAGEQINESQSVKIVSPSVQTKSRPPLPSPQDIKHSLELRKNYLQQHQQQKQLIERQRAESIHSQKKNYFRGKFHEIQNGLLEQEKRSIESSRERILKSKRLAEAIRKQLLQQASYSQDRVQTKTLRSESVGRRESKDERALGNMYLRSLRKMLKRNQENSSSRGEDEQERRIRLYNQRLNQLKKAKIVIDDPIVGIANPLYSRHERSLRVPATNDEAVLLVEQMRRQDKRYFQEREQNLQQRGKLDQLILGSVEDKLALMRLM